MTITASDTGALWDLDVNGDQLARLLRTVAETSDFIVDCFEDWWQRIGTTTQTQRVGD